VLDEMKWYEIAAAMRYQDYGIRDGWEQARLIAYLIAQANSKERLEVDSIIKFPWDKNQDEPPKPITHEVAQKMSEKAAELINKGLI